MIDIKLNSSQHVVSPVSAIVVPTSDAVLRFTSDTFALGQLVATVSGEKVAVSKEKTLDLAPFLKEGAVLEIGVALVIAGRVAMAWYITPITVRSVDLNYELLPEIAALRERCAALEARAERHEDAMLELRNLIKTT
jgi:hypothetical protein